MDRSRRLAFLAPILAFELYLNATLGLFVSDFWPWPLDNPVTVVSFLIAAHLCLLAGFLVSARVAPGCPVGATLTNRVLWAVIVVNVLLLVPTTVSRTGQVVPDLWRAWNNYGEVYLASLTLRASRTHAVEYVRILLGYLVIPLVPLVVFYWQDMSRPMRLLGALAVAWTVALGFAMGINKPIAELAGMLLVFGGARRLSALRPIPVPRQFRYVVVTGAVIALFGLSFYRSQTERVGQTRDRTAFRIGSSVPDRLVRPPRVADRAAAERTGARSQVIQPRRDSLLAERLPLPVLVFLESGALYLTQGYYALGLALELPWQPTWGVGHSFFTVDNAARWFPGVRSRPYPMRIEAFGWDAYRSWSSFYPWVASDLSFGGTLVLMFLIGLGTGVSWKDTLAGSSPFAVAAFGCFLVVILYLPANNQMLQFGEGWTATWGILAAWLIARRGNGVPLASGASPSAAVNASPLQIAFIGAVVPDVPEFRTTAFNRAGNHFQVQLISALRDAGCDVSLVLSQVPRRAAPRSRVLLQSGRTVSLAPGLDGRLVPFVNVSLLRMASVGAAVLPHLLMWARRHRSARRVMLVYNLTEPPGAVVLAAARLTGSKAVASIQDIWLPGESAPDTWRYRADYALHRRLLPRFDALFVASERTREDLAPRVPSLRIEGGVTADQLTIEPTASGDRPFTLVATGTLNYINGIGMILDAFARLRGGAYRLRIAGEGPMTADVSAAAAADPRIEYLGYLDRAACLRLYADADVLLNVRLTESVRTEYFFPSKLIEYLASGVTTISTLSEHTRVTWAPFVVPILDEQPQALADVIAQVAALPIDVRRDRARAARSFVAREWSWKRQGEKAAALLRRVSKG